MKIRPERCQPARVKTKSPTRAVSASSFAPPPSQPKHQVVLHPTAAARLRVFPSSIPVTLLTHPYPPRLNCSPCPVRACGAPVLLSCRCDPPLASCTSSSCCTLPGYSYFLAVRCTTPPDQPSRMSLVSQPAGAIRAITRSCPPSAVSRAHAHARAA